MNRKEKHLSLAGFAVALALLVGVAWFELRHTARMQETAEWVAHTHEVQANRDQLLSLVLEIESEQRSYALTGLPVFLDEFEKATTRLARQELKLEKLTRDERQKAALAALKPLIAERIAIARGVLELRQNSGAEAAVREVATLKGKNLTDEIRERFALMDVWGAVQLDERSAAARSEARQTTRFTFAGAGLGMALLIAVFALIFREKGMRHQAETEIDRFFDLSPDLLGIANTDGYFKRVSPAFTATLGWSAEEIKARPFIDFVHPDDRAATLREVEKLAAGQPTIHFENRYHCKDDSWKWLSWRTTPQPDGTLYATARDVTEEMRTQALETARATVLERLASAGSLGEVFDVLMRHVERIYPDHPSSILLLDDAGRLRGAASTGLPDFYNAAIEGLAIGPGVGSCGEAATRRERSVAEDLETHPNWQPFLELTRRAGLRACWSQPMLGEDGRVLGTFALYSHKPESPGEADIRLLEEVARLAALALQRRQAEEALRRSEENLYVTLASIGDAVLATDAEGMVTRLNPVAEKLTGWTQAEALGRPVAEVFHVINEETRKPAVVPVEKVLATGKIQGLANHAVIIARDGTERPIADRAAPIRSKDGQILGVVLVFRDVSEEKQMEQAIRESEALNRAVLNSVMANIAVVDRHGQIIAINEGWERFAQENCADAKSPSVGVGANYLEVCARAVRDMGDEAQEVLDGLRGVLAHSQMTFGHEYACHSPTEQRWFTMQVSHLGRAEGGAVIAQINITERKRAELELAQLARRVMERTADLSAANAELARASRLKSEFLANMSHELRTPLNAILGLSESLLEQRSGPLTERQVRAVTTVESSGRHLLSLINDVLDVSKVEAGKLGLNVEAVDVRGICEASLQFVRQQASGKHLDLRFTCEMDAPPLHADPRRLKQILVNLLSNAVKFTPEGGKIGLDVCGDIAQGCIAFTVWDTGIGIAPEDQPRLFQPFVQVQSGLSRDYEGTGLGLVLVQRLAELHGGSVTLDSEPGRGSRFSVTLPWNHADLASGSRLPVQAEPISGVRGALIIEDARSASEQLERYLSEMQVRSVIHECATGALERAVEVKPDVILLDTLLPDASGWEVLRQLKADERTRQIPVVVISVVDERGSPQAAGAAGYLVKPISREQLKAALGHPEVIPALAERTGPTILLAEDNEANLQTIGDYLLDHGFRVLVARNGVEAIERLRTEQPALVLMDIQMPVMDGLEAMRHIRSDPALARVPIIALTALAMLGDRERCLAAGAKDYLSKPVSLRQLVERIRQLIHLPAPV